MTTSKLKLPKSIGDTIDLLFNLGEARRALEAQAKTISEQETAVRDHLMRNFKSADLEGAKGKSATCVIKRSIVAEVEDWDKYYAYIGRTKAWDLLQRRPSITALRERWDAGKVVPGVSSKEIETLSLTKAK